MSEKPSALSTIAPQPPAEGEYDLICATVAESTRGRWFLDEYARRNRHADTVLVLAAIERIEDMIRGERDQQVYQSFRGDLLDMAKVIAQTRAEVAAIEPEAPTPATPPAALASRDIFAAAERLQDVAWTMRERGLDARICQQIESLASSILLASSLRNPDDHRTQKLGEVLHYLERRINAMLDACTDPVQARADEVAIDQPSTDRISPDEPPAYQASPDEEVEETASALLHGSSNGHEASDALILPDQELPDQEQAPQESETFASTPAPVSAVSVAIAAMPPTESEAPIAADAQEPAVEVTEPPPAPAPADEPAATPPVEMAAAPVETEARDEPASAPERWSIPQIELEPLVVVPVAWHRTPSDGPPAELEHAPIRVEPLFPERLAEAPVVAPPPQPAPSPAPEPPTEATAAPIFKPPEAAVVFLVEYPETETAIVANGVATEAQTDAPPSSVESSASTTAASEPADFRLETFPPLGPSHVPAQAVPVAGPTPSVERSVVMMADADNEPRMPAPADTAAPTAQSHAYVLPPAEPVPQPPAAPPAAPSAAPATAAPSDPLAALRAMTPEERIALFT